MTATTQVSVALKAANEIRAERSAIRGRLVAGPTFVSWRRCAELFDTPPRAIVTAEVGQVLRWCYRMEERQLRMLLAAGGVQSETRQIGELTGRQRTVLANGLRAFWEDDRC